MSWAGLANNQIVSFNNLQDAVNTGQFTALAAIPVSNEEITKTDASTYVDCWTGYSLFANKASNQLIAKRDLVTTSTTTTTTTLVGILASFEGQVTANVIASGNSTADAQIDVNGISTNIDVAISQSGAGSSSITQPPTGVIQQILYLGDIVNFDAINTVGGSMTYSYEKFTTEDGTTTLQSGTSITAYAYTITATDLTKTNLKFTNIVTATSA